MSQPGVPDLVRILLVDDHPMVMVGLRLLLEREANFHVVGEATNAKQALPLVRETQPHVVVLDLDLGEFSDNGVTLARKIRTFSTTKLLIVSGNDSPVLVQQLLQHRIAGFLLKEEAAETIVAAVAKVSTGGLAYSEKIQGQLADRAAGSGFFALSKRQQEIVICFANGLADKEISDQCNISVRTVQNHASVIYAKLNLGTRQEVSTWAWRNGVMLAIDAFAVGNRH